MNKLEGDFNLFHHYGYSLSIIKISGNIFVFVTFDIPNIYESKILYSYMFAMGPTKFAFNKILCRISSVGMRYWHCFQFPTHAGGALLAGSLSLVACVVVTGNTCYTIAADYTWGRSHAKVGTVFLKQLLALIIYIDLSSDIETQKGWHVLQHVNVT